MEVVGGLEKSGSFLVGEIATLNDDSKHPDVGGEQWFSKQILPADDGGVQQDQLLQPIELSNQDRRIIDQVIEFIALEYDVLFVADF